MREGPGDARYPHAQQRNTARANSIRRAFAQPRLPGTVLIASCQPTLSQRGAQHLTPRTAEQAEQQAGKRSDSVDPRNLVEKTSRHAVSPSPSPWLQRRDE